MSQNESSSPCVGCSKEIETLQKGLDQMRKITDQYREGLEMIADGRRNPDDCYVIAKDTLKNAGSG